MAVKITQFLTHDNPFKLLFEYEDPDTGYKTPVDFISTGVTRMVIVLTGMEIDSDVEGQGSGSNNVFDWTTEGANGIVGFNLGNLTTQIPEGSYSCNVVVYDPVHDDGQVWYRAFKLSVRPQQVT